MFIKYLTRIVKINPVIIDMMYEYTVKRAYLNEQLDLFIQW
jgi:hypothetical protein